MSNWDLMPKKHHELVVPGNVVACLQELGVSILRQNEDEIQGHCPAHERITGKKDSHPSWSVNIKTGLHGCWSCGFKGQFASIVVEQLGCSYDDAFSWIKEHGALDRAKVILGLEEGYFVDDREFLEIKESDLALFTSPPPEILRERKITQEAAAYYGIVWDKEKDSWIIPIRDPYDYSLLGWQEKSTKKRFFMNYPKHVAKGGTIFGFQRLVTTSPVILVESPLDVARIRSAGIWNACASYGANVSEKQQSLLAALGLPIILALDNDAAGINATDDLLKKMRGMRIKIFNYPKGVKDPGDMEDKEIWDGISKAYSRILWKK